MRKTTQKIETLKAFQTNYQPSLLMFHDMGETYREIKQKILQERNIDLDQFVHEVTTRITKAGYRMGYHRDNYLLRRFGDRNVFIAFDGRPTPVYTLLWYQNNDFTGGSLEFLGDKVYRPKKGMFLFFDPNQIHRVNQQLSGERQVIIYKYYRHSLK